MEFEWVNNDHNTSVYCLNNPDIVKSLTSDTYLLHASPQQPDDIYRTLILVLTIPIAILDILGFIIFIALHNNYLLIKARPIYMNLIMAVTSFTWNMVIMKIEISGRHSMRCSNFIGVSYFVFGITITLLPLWLIVYVVKLIEAKIYVYFTVKSREGDAPKAHLLQDNGHNDDKSSNLYRHTPRLIDTMHALFTSKNGVVNIEALVKKIEAYESDAALIQVADGEVRSKSSGAQRSYFSSLFGINMVDLWNEFFLPNYFLIFGLIPTIVTVSFRISSFPLMVNDCYGCEFEIVDAYLIGISGALAAIFVILVIYFSRNEPDPLKVKQELTIMLCLCGPLGVLTFLLLFIHPEPHQTYKFSYYLLSNAAIFLVYFTMSWVQLGLAIWKRGMKRKYTFSLDIIANHELLSTLLLQHCTNELCAENYLFFKEARLWRSEYSREDKRYLRERARAIYTTYLSPKSPFEINISGVVRDELIKQLKRANENDPLPENIFDKALGEIRELLTHDILPRFFASKDFKEKVVKTDLIDQLQVGYVSRHSSLINPASDLVSRAIAVRG